MNPHSLNDSAALAVAHCLSDFFKKTDSTKEIMDFVQASPYSINGWKKGILPVGERYIRLLYFLQSIGYEVAEIKSLPAVVQEAGAYIAFGAVSVANMAAGMGQIKEKRIFEYIHGSNGISEERATKLRAVLTENSSLFEQKRREFALRMDPLIHRISAEKLTPEKLIQQFATACKQVRTLGNALLDGPRDIRFLMREEIGKGKEPLLHTTWETLNRLLVERGEIKG